MGVWKAATTLHERHKWVWFSEMGLRDTAKVFRRVLQGRSSAIHKTFDKYGDRFPPWAFNEPKVRAAVSGDRLDIHAAIEFSEKAGTGTLLFTCNKASRAFAAEIGREVAENVTPHSGGRTCRVKIGGNGVRVRFPIDSEDPTKLNEMVPRLNRLFSVLEGTPFGRITHLEEVQSSINHLDNGEEFSNQIRILERKIEAGMQATAPNTSEGASSS